MLTRTKHFNGVVTYQSPLLTAANIPHAFSTRIGGVSSPPFDSLNLGNPSGCAQQDDNTHIQQNYQLLQHTLGVPNVLRAWVKQVHGTRVELIEAEGESEYAETLEAEIQDRFHGQTEADALMTDQPNILLTIRIADCVPILLASEDGHWVAAVHAGWRGVVNSIVPKTVRAMGELGMPPSRILAAIGPAISLQYFEVGPEVAFEFDQVGLSGAVDRSFTPKPHIDLQGAVNLQLALLGVTQVDHNDVCTMHDSSEFFSHRRDHGVTGRMAAVIMPAQI